MSNFLKGLWSSDKRDRLHPVASALSGQQSPVSSSSSRARSSSPAAVATPEAVREKVGLFELSDKDVEKTVDVVAVHGLQGDAFKTWEHDNGSLWLRDFLPDDIPYARIMSFGYDSMVAFSNSVAKLEDKALELLNRLSTKRNIAGRSCARPIVFVCHSLGGLVVKNALIIAHERTGDVHYKDILDNTKAIAFLGVPHSGSNSAWWASIAVNALKAASIGVATNSALVEDLKRDSTTLTRISKQFVDRGKDLVIYTFYETQKVSGILVVDELSARIGLPNEKLFAVDANHRTMCKFPAADSQAYEGVGPWIVDLVKNASIERPTLEAGLATMHLNEERPRLYYEVPNRRVSSLIGRADIMSRIDNAFTASSEPNNAGSGPRIAVLQAMGGQGKSQVALHYCHKKKNNPFSAIFWVDAMTKNSVERSFYSISEYIKTPDNHMPDSKARVSFVLRTLSAWSIQWLMVFDNYDDPGAFLIQDFIPQSDLGAIIVTSRHAGTVELVLEHRSRFIELPGLNEKDALELLFLHSQIEEASSTNASVGEDIVRTLGYHPLAITQAGSYIRKRTISLHEFVNDYKRRKMFILKNTPQLSEYRRRLGDDEKETSLNVFTTWDLSFEQLQSQTSENSPEIKLLTLFAFFDNKDISERLFSELLYIEERHPDDFESFAWLKDFNDDKDKWDCRRFMDALMILRDLSLLQTFTKEMDGFYHSSMHPLVKDWIRLRTEQSICQENTLIAAVLIWSVIDKAWDLQHEEYKLPLSIIQNLTTHITAQNENHKTYLPSSFDIPNIYLGAQYSLVHFLEWMGSYELAIIIGKEAVERCTAKFGIENFRTVQMSHALACLYTAIKRHDIAEGLYRKIINVFPRVRGLADKDAFHSFNNLAMVLCRQERLEKAVELQLLLVKNALDKWGPEDINVLISMDNLSRTYSVQGRLEEAEKILLPVLDICLRAIGPQHHTTLTSMYTLACTYNRQARRSEAFELMSKVIDVCTKVHGLSHPSTLHFVKFLNELQST